MDIKIKKKLTRNWFKILQEVVCKDIEQIEKKKIFSYQKIGKEVKMETKAVANLEFLKTEEFLKKLE